MIAQREQIYRALADELYCIEQQYSRKLAGCGAGLKRADIEALRDKL